MKELPENSLALLNHIEIQQKHPNFKYLEFDIRETKDKKLVIFHDSMIRRMLPNKGYNKQRYKELRSQFSKDKKNKLGKIPFSLWRVSDLTLVQLQTLTLNGKYPTSDTEKVLFQVPTLKEYIKKLKANLSKPIVFDIKKLDSIEGRQEFIDQVIKYTRGIGGNRPSGTRYNDFPYQQVSIINLTGLKRNYAETHSACQKLKDNGITIYRGWTHDSLCDFFDKKEKNKSLVAMLKRTVLGFGQRLAVKHHIEQVEAELDPTNYHKPRIVHYEPRTVRSDPKFVYDSIDNIGKSLTRLQAINKKKLIVFVHGRGRHPNKGEPMLAELAKEHGAGVIMFNWDSWICQSYCKELIKPYSSKHPSGNAKAAAHDLATLMESLQTFKKANNHTTVSMLVHSMGNIVFKEVIEKHSNRFSKNEVFIDNLILNSPDVERKDHQKWLKKISFANNTFVTMTRDDFALRAVEMMRYKALLGQGYKPYTASNSLVSGVHYLDFTGIGSSHRKFGHHKYRQFFKNAFDKNSWATCQNPEPNDMEHFDYSCLNAI